MHVSDGPNGLNRIGLDRTGYGPDRTGIASDRDRVGNGSETERNGPHRNGPNRQCLTSNCKLDELGVDQNFLSLLKDIDERLACLALGSMFGTDPRRRLEASGDEELTRWLGEFHRGALPYTGYGKGLGLDPGSGGGGGGGPTVWVRGWYFGILMGL